jgi:SAM-dependent methyltransferase
VADDGYREVFDARGGRYDGAMRRWPRVRDEEFAFVVGLADPQAGETLIDVPAGGGYLSGHLPEGVDVIAVEVAEDFVEQSRGHGVTTVASGLEAAGLPAACADLVVSVAGMHHEDDHRALFAAWRRLLRPGGRLVAADVVAGSAEARFLDGFVGEWTSTGHAGRYFGDDLAATVEAAGYHEVTVVDGRYHWWAADETSLAAFCTSLFGLEDVTEALVLDALAAGPGITVEADRVGLCWGLRAVVGRTSS